MKIAVILILTVALGGPTFAFGIFGILDVVEQGVGIVDTVVNIANGVKELMTGSNEHKELLHRFDETANSIQGLGQDVKSIAGQLKYSESRSTERFETLLRQINSIPGLDKDFNSIIGMLKNMESTGQRLSWELAVETFETLLRRINSKYDLFVFYHKNTSVIERLTLEDFAREAVSHNTDSLQSTMYSLRDLVIGSDLTSEQPDPHGRRRRYAFKLGIFRELKLMVEGSRNTICGLSKSPQQFAYGLYGTLVRALAKDFIMTQFAYMQLRLFGGGSFTAESRHFTESYKNISLAMALEASSVMRELNSTFWRCDPARHERGVTYEEVTKLLQGTLCVRFGDVHRRQVHICHISGTSVFFDNPHDCRKLPFRSTVCIADSRELANAHRRYNWIQYYDGTVLGRKNDGSLGSCETHSDSSGHSFVVDATLICLGLLIDSRVHLCLCDDDTSSERYFSLLPTLSDITENKIVTGVRFVKIGGVFYIQLEQGDADRLGYVKSSSVQWKPIDRHIDINRDVEGRDYVRLSYEKRSVLLQDLRGSPGNVVTGVSFKTFGNHLSLQIRVTAISGSATLVPSLSHWLSGSTSKPYPPSLDLGSDPEVPTVSATPNWPDSQPGQTLTFEASSMKQDVAQTTLPLLDIQPVAPRPAVWLTGIGLYHKGQKGGGGFLGLSVQMADMTLPPNTTQIALRNKVTIVETTVESTGEVDPDRMSRSSSYSPFRPPGSPFIVFALSTLIKIAF